MLEFSQLLDPAALVDRDDTRRHSMVAPPFGLASEATLHGKKRRALARRFFTIFSAVPVAAEGLAKAGR
jgi:hypothetical protein